MSITTITSRELNHDVSKAKKAALSGPVFITDRGRTAHVLLTIDEYKKMAGKTESIVELLAMPGDSNIEFEAPKLENNLYKPVDFS